MSENYYCPHCKFVNMDDSSMFYEKLDNDGMGYTIKEFPSPYTLSCLPNDHISSGKFAYDALTSAAKYCNGRMKVVGFKRIRFLINNNVNPHRKTKEHLHTRIIFDDDVEMFDIFFSGKLGYPIVGGIINKTLIDTMKNRRPSISPRYPFDSDRCYGIPFGEINEILSSREKFDAVVSEEYFKHRGHKFDPNISPLYIFAYWQDGMITSILFSFGS